MNTAYTNYLQSPEWRKRREWCLTFWNHRCALCFSPDNLEVHHRSYERLGNELLTDLIVLCDGCHELFHEKLGRTGPTHIGAVLLATVDRIAAKR